jgi:chemotaxis protein MotB
VTEEDMAEAVEASPADKKPAKPRRKRQAILETAGEGPGEEWMLTYMDTVTLLVTLFVMILSFASFETEKYKEFTQGMSLGRYGAGIMMGTLGIRDKEPASSQIQSLDVLTPAEVPAAPESVQADGKENRLADLQDQIQAQGLDKQVVLRENESTVEMEINESVLFPAASADLSDLGLSVLERLAGLLITHRGVVSVEGHTDNLPIATAYFPSNWELSGARASSVVRRLIESGVSPDKMRIVGYADVRPLANNTSPDGRQKNRRVNIVLEFTEKPTPN